MFLFDTDHLGILQDRVEPEVSRLCFTGRRYDNTTGLYDYRTRQYDPVVGRFTSRDTIGLWGDPANLGNPNTYVGNNPWKLSAISQA